MNRKADYDDAWEKQLESAPLKRKGFTEELRSRIEREIDQRTERRSPRMFLVGTLCTAFLLLAALFAIDLPNIGNQPAQQASDQPPTANVTAAESEIVPDTFKSGLLVGLRSDYGEPSYRTLYIAPREDAPAVVAQGSGILVPYKSSFWKIDSHQYRTETDIYQFFTSRPAGSREEDAQTRGRKLFKDDDPQTRVSHTETILFAANEYVSLEEVEVSAAEYGRNVQKRYWTTTIPELAADRKRVTLNEALEAMFRSSEYETYDWTIRRSKGYWAPYAAASRDTQSPELTELKELDVPLPKKVVNHDDICCSWEELIKLKPDAIDLYTSPEEDMIVVVTQDRLSIYGNKNKLSASPAFSVNLLPKESVVMVQWATGRYVDEWALKTAEYLR
jgi:hypothetical protein